MSWFTDTLFLQLKTVGVLKTIRIYILSQCIISRFKPSKEMRKKIILVKEFLRTNHLFILISFVFVFYLFSFLRIFVFILTDFVAMLPIGLFLIIC